MHKFITVEGIEGCGKTTQIQRLAGMLRARDMAVTTTREPGGCPIADRIRAILLDPASSDMAPTAELLLYAAARAQHVKQVIKPALQAGNVVICDRFTDATLAYQGFGRGLPLSTIETLARMACEDVMPGLTLWLDLPVELGIERARTRNTSQDLTDEGRFDQEDLLFHSKVRQGYVQLQQRHPQRVKRIDASGSEDEVSERLLTTLNTFLNI